MDRRTIDRFMRAVRAGDHATASAMLDERPALANAFDSDCFGATPLIHAAAIGDLAMVDLLIDRGGDPDLPSDWWAGGFRPLDGCDEATSAHLLARGATLTPHAAARLGRLVDLTRLLDADPELVRQRGGDGQFPLHYAATPEIAALLLERGAEIDAHDIDHDSTPAQWAAVGRARVAAFLLSRGATPDYFMACAIDDVPLAERLLATEPGGVGSRITAERFPVRGTKALGIHHYSIGTGCTGLHAAARGGAPRTAAMLVERGADVDAIGGYDDHAPLHAAAWEDNAEVARVLLDAGANIDRRSGRLHNNTPLGWAIVGGSPGVTRLLLERGATVLDFMAADVEAGARGEFRAIRRQHPLENWHRVREAFDRRI